MLKASGIVVTPEELETVNRSEYPLVEAGKMIIKYHMPADAGFKYETGEFYFDL